MVDPIRISSRVRRQGYLIPPGSRTLTQVEVDTLADLRREIAHQEDGERKRQARIRRKRVRRRATFVTPHPHVCLDRRPDRPGQADGSVMILPLAVFLHTAVACAPKTGPSPATLAAYAKVESGRDPLAIRDDTDHCIFRGKSAGDSGMKSATDSDLISAIPT